MSESAPAPTRRSERLRAAARDEFGGTTERSMESLSLSAGVVAFVVVALLSLPVFRLEAAPIAGPGSIGQFVAIASAAVALVAFGAGRAILRIAQRRARLKLLDYLDVAALALAHAIIALLTWTVLATILERSFIGAEVYPVALVALAGATAFVTAYVVFYSATHMDLSLLAIILAVFLVEGVITAMLTASDPQWWKLNLSALGMTDDLSAFAFNLTLIVAGFIVTTLARYVTVGIPTPHPHGARNTRISLIVVGVFLTCVGIFPVDDFFVLHTSVASGMAVAFGVLVIALKWWIPGIARAFLTLGWVFIAVIAVLAIMFATGVYTLTAVELVAGVLVFAWIILFIRNAAALQADTTP
ncbi:DUF998 domain-containing protein [Microbacterium aquimaris]|uniref:DUF998 domain-containing protein n=1 Tax=Microbacterium aquimaris TaxID=459816 RepID=UPI002AD41892|nr:DUF998 domain-containing protein [Microbacterium aquimaris]MDZ8275206.1 DUF998 domain-containing protein [Microbacterium aquimaris]